MTHEDIVFVVFVAVFVVVVLVAAIAVVVADYYSSIQDNRADSSVCVSSLEVLLLLLLLLFIFILFTYFIAPNCPLVTMLFASK
jgi:hypothetical protein